MNRLLTALRRLLGGVLRVAVLLLGALAALAALALGLLLATGLVAWALLRGRRPVVRQAFAWPRRGGRVPPGAAAEVVDIDAREVPEAAAPAPQSLPKG